MREPNIKELIESLAAEDFIENIFKYRETADAEIAQLLYFMQKEQTAALYAEICQMDEAGKNRVFTSLAGLYPLSKYIIFHLLAKVEKTPLDFLYIYDMNKELLKNMQQTLSSMRDNSNAVSLLYNHYLDEIGRQSAEIDNMKDKIETFSNISVQLKEKREEKQILQKELDALERELKPGNLDADIEELQKKIIELSSKKEKRCRQKQKLDKELKELQEALSDQEEAAARRYQKAYSDIQQILMSIEEEG